MLSLSNSAITSSNLNSALFTKEGSILAYFKSRVSNDSGYVESFSCLQTDLLGLL
jgi:hypothetical protein